MLFLIYYIHCFFYFFHYNKVCYYYCVLEACNHNVTNVDEPGIDLNDKIHLAVMTY